VRLAVLDVGSNTVHLVVVDGRPDGSFMVVARERDTLRLAEAAFPSMILPGEAVDRLVASVARMRAVADGLRAGAITGFATSAIREARNGLDVLGRVREVSGVTIKVLPGVEEARLTYLAARRWTAFSARRLLVLDIGGGSLEVAGGEGERPELAESLPLGATRLTRRFVRSDPVRPEELVELRVHALALLGPLADRIREAPWEVTCATSKTFRNLGEVARALPGAPTPAHEFGFAGVDGQTAPILTREALNVVAGYLAGTTARDRRSLTGLDNLRAGNVVAGSQVAALVMQAFGLRELVLAPWALREGVILETLGELGPAERELLEAAGLLHDVGYAVAQSSRHKHSLYLIRNAGLDGWSLRELLMMGNVARYHRKALPSQRHGDYLALEEPDRLVVRRLAALLRVAEGLDADHFQVVEAAEVVDEGSELRLELRARDDPDLWSAGQNADLFEAEFGRPLVPVATEVV